MKTYKIPEIKINMFQREAVIAASGENDFEKADEKREIIYSENQKITRFVF